MAEYYLISQLPSLDAIGENMPIPITEERFSELCHRFLSKKSQQELDNLSLLPPKVYEKSNSPLIEAWNEGERNLRIALGKVRAEKYNKNFDAENSCIPVEIMQLSRTAVETESPLEAEKLLNDYRLNFLETLRPMDTFSQDFVFYYALKLKLVLRMRKFDTESGKTEYKNIYNSIINGDRLEAE